MMRSRDDGKKTACAHCGVLTVFERWFLGKRGAQHRESCCANCGPYKDAESYQKFGSAA